VRRAQRQPAVSTSNSLPHTLTRTPLEPERPPPGNTTPPVSHLYLACVVHGCHHHASQVHAAVLGRLLLHNQEARVLNLHQRLSG
jgi:hypothetical protein